MDLINSDGLDLPIFGCDEIKGKSLLKNGPSIIKSKSPRILQLLIEINNMDKDANGELEIDNMNRLGSYKK